MAILRAVSYFVTEALTSLWRSRMVNAVSIGTISVSLFVLGAFLTLAAALSGLVTRWTETVQVTVYLEDRLEPRVRESLENRLRDDPAVATLTYVSRELALERFRAMFRDLSSLPEDLGENPFPASLEVTLRPERQSPGEVERLAKAFGGVPGVREIQYDLLWIERLSTGVRLVFAARRADSRAPEPIELDIEFAEAGGEGPTPYEVLLHAAMIGNTMRFTRQDGVEEAWRIMQPLLDAPSPVHVYKPGTWGPEAASALVSGYGRWHEAWIAQ